MGDNFRPSRLAVRLKTLVAARGKSGILTQPWLFTTVPLDRMRYLTSNNEHFRIRDGAHRLCEPRPVVPENLTYYLFS